MARQRLIFHPVFTSKRSRILFFCFLVEAIVVGGGVWWHLSLILKEANIPLNTIQANSHWILNVLLSVHFKYAVIFISAIIAGGFTGHLVVGPVKRIENWARNWQAGHKISKLRIRSTDKYFPLSRLLNELREKHK